MEINKITGLIVDAAYRIHEEAGPGLLESVYESILADILTGQACWLSARKSFRSNSAEKFMMKLSGLISSSRKPS